MKRTQLWYIVGLALIAASTARANTNQYKWYQPPVPGGGPTNVFYGWNQTSTENIPGAQNFQAADDWVCTTTNPVTKVRWWGSFANWQAHEPPPSMPGAPNGALNGFWIIFFRDVPAGMDLPWSHPMPGKENILPPLARFYTNYTWRYVGQDYDPRTGTYESCFLFEQELIGDNNYIWWFYQTNSPTGTNIFWLSIIANQYGYTPPSPPMDHFWGWKTRPRDPNSPAPDDAVTYNIDAYDSGSVIPYNFQPIWWPDPTNSWDLAFELMTAKWEQPPDLSSEGMDVNATTNSPAPVYLLADDFQCTSTGLITNITIWGSWQNDMVPFDPTNVAFTLSFHTNVPAGPPPSNFSRPGANQWTRTFQPGQFTCTVEQAGLNEWWMDPQGGAFPGGDHVCYRYDFTITSSPYFNQQGTVARPAIYWLDVQARVQGTTIPAQFGWKTSRTHWMDAACWVAAGEPYNGNAWQPLTYPPGHPRYGMNIDLAFRLNNLPPKWSQPPDPYTPTNAFNGWNQYSVYGGTNIVADDWVCTNAAPVTDIHWWGSFIGWTSSNLPPMLPNGFIISIWNDVPKGAGVPFSHPGICLTNIYCPALVPTFVGWDYDPRNPGDPPDACFKYDLDLAPDQWFRQAPGTNIYWISIAAQYLAGPNMDYPWGWKTRPRDANSLAPDDAVRIIAPTAPIPGMPYYEGTNIWWPTPGDSWDMAFALTTRQCPPPTLTCLDLNVECGLAWSPPFAWDNCCNVALTPVLVGSVTNGACPWLITETWKATDCIGQTNVCNRVITVADTTPPAITCASDKTVECGASWSFDPPSAPDVCCGTNVTISIMSTVTNGFCPWVITRTWMATDCCTNSKTCSQTVTVADTTPPTITCATNKTVLAGAVWNFDPPTASDVCCGSNVTVSVLSTITNGNCPWYITRTWKATDCCTNSKTCSQVVTVLCPANKWVQEPDLTPSGMDVKASWPKILADDFLCTKTGPITNIHIWASWLGDQPDPMATFQLGLWSDVPRSTAPQGELLANGTFELAFTPAGFSGPLDVVADFIPPSWNRQETFSGNVPENSYIGPIALNGPSAPGLQAAHFYRSGSGQDGDWTAIYQNLSINATQYSALTLSLDVRVLYHDLEAGGHIAPKPSFEWPAVLEVDYVDTNGVGQIWRYGWYLYPPGDFVTGQINDPGQGLIPFYKDQLIPQPGMWVPNTFNLLNELPQARTITRILVGGSGWNFESDVDNVSIRGTSFSHPGELLWMTNFMSGQYTFTNELGQLMQPFYDPNYQEIIGSDSVVWHYDFPVVETNRAFYQTNGTIYWLSVSEWNQMSPAIFGWKTALTNWNDDAVYGHVDQKWIPLRDWQELFSPPQMPPVRSLDLAFRLTTMWVGAAPVITNIVVTNQVTPTATNQVVGLSWTYESGIHYQVLSATNLTAGGSNIVWTLCGPDIVAPNHSYWGTNAAGPRRFYRVNAFDP